MSRRRPAMRLVLEGGDAEPEGFDVGRRHAPRDGLLELDEVLMDALGGAAPLRRRGDDERAPIRRADVARDQPALDEAIEDARQRGALVREAAVQLLDGRG